MVLRSMDFFIILDIPHNGYIHVQSVSGLEDIIKIKMLIKKKNDPATKEVWETKYRNCW